jgi:hypothetical protein
MDIVGIMWENVYMDGIVDNVYDGKYCVVIECRWNGDWWIWVGDKCENEWWSW